MLVEMNTLHLLVMTPKVLVHSFISVIINILLSFLLLITNNYASALHNIHVILKG